MSTLFISDLHLHPKQPEIKRILLNFIQQQAIHAEALYILGDFFSMWIGDDDIDFNKSLVQAIRTLTYAKVPVYFMPGNRDFLIRANSAFIRDSGCIFLSDPTKIDLYGLPTLLTHGDLLCTKDKRYLLLRRFTRIQWLQTLFLALPFIIRKKIATQIKKSNKKIGAYYSEINKHKFDATLAGTIQMMTLFQVNRLIHGHTHNPGFHLFQKDQQLMNRITLSDWQDQGNALLCEPDGSCRLIYFR